MTLQKDPDLRAGVGDCLKHPYLLLPRSERIHQLSVEFERSRATSTVVEESDILAVRTMNINGNTVRKGSIELMLTRSFI